MPACDTETLRQNAKKLNVNHLFIDPLTTFVAYGAP